MALDHRSWATNKWPFSRREAINMSTDSVHYFFYVKNYKHDDEAKLLGYIWRLYGAVEIRKRNLP
jgi:hypothetical protein